MTKLTPGEKAAQTNREKHGKDYYKDIRAKVKNPGLGAISDPELRRQKARAMAELRWRKHKASTNEKISPTEEKQNPPSQA